MLSNALLLLTKNKEKNNCDILPGGLLSLIVVSMIVASMILLMMQLHQEEICQSLLLLSRSFITYHAWYNSIYPDPMTLTFDL